VRVISHPFDRTIPDAADVVVIGGGIVGTSAALFLTEHQVSVALCEKGFIGAEQSGRALGWVRVAGRDPRDVPLNLHSRRLWAGLNQAIAGETGYRASGNLFVSSSAAELASHEAWLRKAHDLEVDSRIVDAKEVSRLLPACTANVVGALYTPGDGCAEPTMATAAIAAGVHARGGRIVTQCAVRGIETQAGRVSGVVTEQGLIATQAVLLAGGIWSSLLCANQNLDLPLLPVGSYLMRTTPVDGPDICVLCGLTGIRRNLDGGYTVGSARSLVDVTPETLRRFLQFLPALRTRWRTTRLRLSRRFFESRKTTRPWRLDQQTPFERDRVHDAGAAPWMEGAWQEARRLYPFFKDAAVAEQWGGFVDVTPDVLPVISPIENLPGFFVAAGFSGGGFGAGPGAGKLAADLIMGIRPAVDPMPYRYSRFFDGSKLAPAH